MSGDKNFCAHHCVYNNRHYLPGITPTDFSIKYISVPECPADSDFSDDQLDSDCEERQQWGQPHLEKKSRVAAMLKAQRLRKAKEMKSHFAAAAAAAAASTEFNSVPLKSSETNNFKRPGESVKTDVAPQKRTNYSSCGYSYQN